MLHCRLIPDRSFHSRRTGSESSCSATSYENYHNYPLEKSPEEVAGKRLCVESSASRRNGIISHVTDLATNNLLSKCGTKLAVFYSHQPEVPESTWPPVKKTQYINFALIRAEQAVGKVCTEVEKDTCLVFEGRPGCGKTTMMNKVSPNWSNEKSFVSFLLFLVHHQGFGNQSDSNHETVLRSTLVAFTDKEFEKIRVQVESNQWNCAILALDGLDEYYAEKKVYNLTFIHKLIITSRLIASQNYQRATTNCIEVLGLLKYMYESIDSYFDDEDQDEVGGIRTYLEHHPSIEQLCYLPVYLPMVVHLFDIEGVSLPQTEMEIYSLFTFSTLLRSVRNRNDMEVNNVLGLSIFKNLNSDDRKIFLKLDFQATVVEPQQVCSHDNVQIFSNKQSSNTENDDNSLGLTIVDQYFIKYGLKEFYFSLVERVCCLPPYLSEVYDIEGASLPQSEAEIYNQPTLLCSFQRRNGMEVDEVFGLSTFEDLSSGNREIFIHVLELAFRATIVEARQIFSCDDFQRFLNKQSSNIENDDNFLGFVVVDQYFVKYGLEEIPFQEYLAACHIVQLSSEDQKKFITNYKKLEVVWKFYNEMTQFSDEQNTHSFEQLFETTKCDLLLRLHCYREDTLCTHVVESYNSNIILDKKSLNPSDFTAVGYVLVNSNVSTTKLATAACHISPEGLATLIKAINEYSLSLKVLRYNMFIPHFEYFSSVHNTIVTFSFYRTKMTGMIPEFCGILKQCPHLHKLV